MSRVIVISDEAFDILVRGMQMHRSEVEDLLGQPSHPLYSDVVGRLQWIDHVLAVLDASTVVTS